MRSLHPRTRLLLLPLLLAAGACGNDAGWTPQPITSYAVGTDGTVRVAGHCNPEGRVVVVDDDSARVTVRLEVSGPAAGDCLRCPVVPLHGTLGHRTLVDETSGRIVAPNPGAC